MSLSRGSHTLELRRVFGAPPEDVFRAWTEPAQLREWFRPPGGSSSAEVDLRVDGQYRISMRARLGRAIRSSTAKEVYVVGRFLEVDPPRRLVYTFDWEGLRQSLAGETLVTVEFHDRGGSTELVLRHERLRRGGHRTFHSFGWRTSLRSLGRVVGRANRKH